MTDQELATNGHNPLSNGALSQPAAFQLGEEFGSKKEKKKRKKQQKKAEERERRETLERMDAAHPRLDLVALKETEKAPPEEVKPQAALRIQAWLRPVSKSLDLQRTLTAQKSSFVIGINCLMLAIAAHAIYSGLGPGQLKWAMIPLALTNVLSLTFAILSAQVQQKPSALDELWAMPADEYQPAVASMLQDKPRAYAALADDLHHAGAELVQRQKHLRTAYSVLLGGVAGSSCVFAICVALGA